MAATPIPFATKDKSAAAAQLNATVSAVATSIVLQSGHGAKLPQPYNGTATSLGTATTLNSTGILAIIGSGSVGKLIWDQTDGSVAVITAVNTNSVTTTRLLGGTSNIWSNSDTWVIDPFVCTLANLATSTYGVISDNAYEEVLIVGRSTDTLTVGSGGRGYNGTSAQQFVSGDYAYLRSTSPVVERLRDIISVIAQKLDSYQTTTDASVLAILNASSFYAVATGSANAYAASYANITGSLAAGMVFFFKANFANTSAATLTVTLSGSAQSAKTIKKLDGATDVVANNIASGQIVVVEYDGTNFQMLSPVGNSPTANVLVKYVNSADSNDISTDTSAADWNTNYTVPANDLAAGIGYVVEAWGLINGGTNLRRSNIGLNLGSTNLLSFLPWVTINGQLNWHVRCEINCRSTGGSGSVEATGVLTAQTAAYGSALASTDTVQQIIAPALVTVDTTASAALKLTNYWNVNDGSKSSIIKNITITRLG